MSAHVLLNLSNELRKSHRVVQSPVMSAQLVEAVIIHKK